MSANISSPNTVVYEFTANLAQAAATYDLCTVTGDMFIEKFAIYVATVGATFTSASVQTNQTTAWNLMTSAEGAVANLAAQKNMNTATTNIPFVLKSGQKIQYTIVGPTGTGSLRVELLCRPITSGASLA